MTFETQFVQLESDAACTIGPFQFHWVRSAESSLCTAIAVAEKFSHAETVGVEILLSDDSASWMLAFLNRASQAYREQAGGVLDIGWHWVRYSGLHGTKEVPAEWDGHHWGSTSFAGLPRNAVEVLGSIPMRMPAAFPLSELLQSLLAATPVWSD
ncbi:hypothetical protein [Pseudomonas baetica]|uniref:hypothetical protein n=1 Tax=Pseudomonas baetica TaxID=674054 RepID=UPI002405BF9E|nr:hypothetical protein [Pseudomonas baetica]MDF9779236.1 hypothetical protein [Pseudomonas baetica]